MYEHYVITLLYIINDCMNVNGGNDECVCWSYGYIVTKLIFDDHKKNRSKGTNGVKFELDIEKLTLSDTKMKWWMMITNSSLPMTAIIF